MVAKSKSLAVHLATVPDPRSHRGLRHNLLDILVLRHLVVNLLSRDPNPKGRSIKALGRGPGGCCRAAAT